MAESWPSKNEGPESWEDNTCEVYLVFLGEDKEKADWVEARLEEKAIRVLRYDKHIGGQHIPELHMEWSQRAWSVLLLVSNSWTNPSNYLTGEISNLLIEMNNRIGQFVYAISFEKLTENVLRYAGQLAKVDRISQENYPRIIAGLAKKFQQKPNRKIFASPSGTSPLGTGPLGKGELRLTDTIENLMTHNLHLFIDGQHELADLIAFWTVKGFRHFPIVDSETSRKLLGIVSLRNILSQIDPEPEVLNYIGIGGGLVFPENIQLSSFMTPHTALAPLVVAKPSDTIESAVKKLAYVQYLNTGKHRISAVPIIDDRSIIHGVVSYIDILKRVVLPKGLVEDFMTDVKKKRVHVVVQGESLKHANQEMGDFRDLPVLDQDRKTVIGMISEYEMRRNFRLPGGKYDTTKVPVELVMKPIENLPVLVPEDSVDKAVSIFITHRTLGAIVVRESGSNRLRGVISYVDILITALSGGGS